MNKKLIIFAGGTVLLLALAINFFISGSSSNKDYVFDKSSNVTLEDVKEFKSSSSSSFYDFDENSFKGGVVNKHTLGFFSFLQKKFSGEATIEEHLNDVREYLYSVMPKDEAEKTYEIYKAFMKYQTEFPIAAKDWDTPKSIDGAVEYLHNVQNYRRETLGKDVADALFGTEMKAKEYTMRQKYIVNDKDMLAEEKLKALRELNRDMFGEEGSKDDLVPQEGNDYSTYRNELNIYEADLDKMSESEKNYKIREIRRKYFDSETVKQLEENDRKYDAAERKLEKDGKL